MATTPDGKTVEVAAAGKSLNLPKDSIDIGAKDVGFGQPLTKDAHVIVRPGVGTMPDGSAVLDAYPNTPEQYAAAYTPSDTPGVSVPKPKFADHFKLPSNMTVEADLPPNGHSTASGADESYYMSSGWGDAKNAAAKNYTGATDAVSARELLRIRGEAGLTEPTQAEAKLKADEAAEKPSVATETPEDKLFKDPAAFESTLSKAVAGNNADVVDYISKLATYTEQPGVTLTKAQMQQVADGLADYANSHGLKPGYSEGKTPADFTKNTIAQALEDLGSGLDGNPLEFYHGLTTARANFPTEQAGDNVWRPGDDAKDPAAAGFKPSDNGDAAPITAVERVAAALGGVQGVDGRQLDVAFKQLNEEQRRVLDGMSEEDRAAMMERIKGDLETKFTTEQRDSGGRLLGAAAILAALGGAIAFYEYMHKDDKAEAPVVTYGK